jgi:flavorubredoxin
MKKAVILYWSSTRNTEKVAFAIKEGWEAAGVNVSLRKTTEAKDIDYFDYDPVCVGSPSIRWYPPKQVTDFFFEKFDHYHEQKRVKTGAPKISRKNALIFCTYSGPHTGINEATRWASISVNSLSISASHLWTNGTFSANIMVQ